MLIIRDGTLLLSEKSVPELLRFEVFSAMSIVRALRCANSASIVSHLIG